MNMAHDSTLANIKATVLPQAEVSFRASEFLSAEEQEKLTKINQRSHRPRRAYDPVDAYEAELLARFGWQAFQAWLKGDFEESMAARFIAAERAREARSLEPLAAMILSANAGANNGDKNGHAPKSLRNAQNIMKNINKQAKGDQ